jgi:hypothetical protein
VRVHLLHDTDTPAASTKLTEEDITRIFKKANLIWQTAGVHLWVESIVSEKPASTIGFENSSSLTDQALLPLRPAATLEPGMFHVYYIGSMAPNGIFIRRDGIFVKETAQLRPVTGGIDEPLPRVTAHELGHGMGLPHRQDTFNLMASGTTGTGLNEAEVVIVRTTLDRLPWVQTPELFLKQGDQLESAGNKAEALSHYRVILEIPGESSIKKLVQTKLGKVLFGQSHSVR